MNLYGSFYEYNYNKFMIYFGLVMNYFDFDMNDYGHYYELV